MKKSSRRLVAAVVTAALVGALGMFGCSSNATSSAASASSAAPASQTAQLQIFAANSLQKALPEVQALYTEKNPGITFADTQFKGSGDLVTMLQGGQAADLLITASKGTMDTSVKDGLVDEKTRFNMFTNDLVIVTGKDNTAVPENITLEEAVSGKYTIGIGTDNVPAGNYARQSISTIVPVATVDGKKGSETDGKVGTVEGEGFAGTALDGKVKTADSVGNVAKLAGAGEVDIAFVYTSDVQRYSDQVKQLSVVLADTHKAIVYPAAITSTTKSADAVQAFLDWATTDAEALKIWQKWGFELAAK